MKITTFFKERGRSFSTVVVSLASAVATYARDVSRERTAGGPEAKIYVPVFST